MTNYFIAVDANGAAVACYSTVEQTSNTDGTADGVIRWNSVSVPAGTPTAAEIPAGALGVTEEQWNVAMAGPATWNGEEFVPVAPVPIPPAVISDRQFFQQLAMTPDPSKTDGSTIISEADALAAVCTGTVPPAMEPLIAGLPADQQFAAKMKIAGATQFDLTDPVTQAIGQANGWTTEQLNQFWLAASKL